MADQRTQDLHALQLMRQELAGISEKQKKIAKWQDAIKRKNQSVDEMVKGLSFTPSEKRKRLDAEYRYYHRKEVVKVWKALSIIAAILGVLFALVSCIYLFPMAATKISHAGLRWVFYIVHSILCLILAILPFLVIPSPGSIGSDEQKGA